MILDALLPLMGLVALGVGLRAFGFADMAFFRRCNALVFWVALPALLLVSTSGGAENLGSAMKIFQVLALATAGCIAASYALALLLRLPRSSMGCFVQGGFRGNLAYVGLAVIQFSAAPQDAERLVALAALAIAPLIPLYNLAAVLVLLGGGARGTRGARGKWVAAGDMALKVVTNPLLIACVIGVGMSVMGIPMPVAAGRFLEAVGRIALPLALIGIGATLTPEALRGDLALSSLASAIKLALAPLLGVLLAKAMGCEGDQIRIAAIMLATPTAVASYVMADQLGANGRLAASIVLLSTILSSVTLAGVLWLT